MRTLGTIGLYAGAFDLGWRIGRQIDTRWLHLSGDVGTYAGGQQWITAARWIYVYPGQTVRPAGSWILTEGGWRLQVYSTCPSWSGWQAEYYHQSPPNVSTCVLAAHEQAYAVAAGQSLGELVPSSIGGNCAGGGSSWIGKCYVRQIREADMDSRIVTLADLPFTGIGQRVDVTTAWNSSVDLAKAIAKLTFPFLSAEEDKDVGDYIGSTTGGPEPNPFPGWRVPECFGLSVAACATRVYNAATAAGYAPPTYSTSTVTAELAELFEAAGAVLHTAAATYALGEHTHVIFYTNPDPVPGSGGGAGDDGSGPPTTTSPDGDKCEFASSTGMSWDVEAQDPEMYTYYEEACQEEWDFFWATVGGTRGQLPGDIIQTAKTITTGPRLGNVGLKERLAELGPIENWAKVATRPFRNPVTNRLFEVHFYRLRLPGQPDAVYLAEDFKLIFKRGF